MIVFLMTLAFADTDVQGDTDVPYAAEPIAPPWGGRIPSNPRLVLYTESVESYAFVHDDLGSVPATHQPLPNGRAGWTEVVPTESLGEGDWRLELTAYAGVPTTDVHYVSTGAPDDTAPAPPTIDTLQYEWITPRLPMLRVTFDEADPNVYLWHATAESDAGHVEDLVRTYGTEVGLWRSWLPPGSDGVVTVTLRSRDLAGNLSEPAVWTGEVTVPDPPVPSDTADTDFGNDTAPPSEDDDTEDNDNGGSMCGCATGGSVAWPLAVVLLIMGASRRRRTRGPTGPTHTRAEPAGRVPDAPRTRR